MGKRDLYEIERVDLEAFVEHEQGRGMHIYEFQPYRQR